MSFDTKLNLTTTISDDLTAEQYISKLSNVTNVRGKYSAQAFTIADGITDFNLDINDMTVVSDIILSSDQQLTAKINGLTDYAIQNEEQTSTAIDRVSTNSIINSVQGVYLTSSSMVIGTAGFLGAGLNDLTTGGVFTGTGSKRYRVIISTSAGTDKFDWSDDNGQSWTIGVTITGFAQVLSSGITITFGAVSGHTLSNTWIFEIGHTGTNYFSGGSFNVNEIDLGVNLPTATEDVLIDYTTSAEIAMTEKLVLQGSSVKSLSVTNNSGNTANLYIVLAGD